LVRVVLDPQLEGVLVFLEHLEHLDEEVDVSALRVVGVEGLQLRVGREVDDRVVGQVLDRPFPEALEDAFVHTEVERVILTGKFVWVIVAMADLSLIVLGVLVAHLLVRGRVVALERVLRLG